MPTQLISGLRLVSPRLAGDRRTFLRGHFASRCFLRLGWAVGAGFLLVGCAGETLVSDEGSSAAGSAADAFQVTLADGTELAGADMLVEVYEGDVHTAPVSVMPLGGVGGDVWQMQIGLDVETLTSGREISAEVVDGVAKPGLANVKRFTGEGEGPSHSATSGKVKLLLNSSKPLASGSVDAEPQDLSATFEGRFRVRCFKIVPSDDPSSQFQEDGSFSSTFCQQFAMWK